MKKIIILSLIVLTTSCAHRYRNGGYSQQAWGQAIGNIGGQLAAPTPAPAQIQQTTCNPNMFGGFTCGSY